MSVFKFATKQLRYHWGLYLYKNETVLGENYDLNFGSDLQKDLSEKHLLFGKKKYTRR